MYAAISGLKSHMQKLNVIGNNISNVNTAGYKAASTTFKESLYTTITAGSNGTALSGGINPSQVGYGCSVGSIALDMSTKNYIPDGDGLHCMIDGSGFFMVGDKPYTTVGADGEMIYSETRAADLNLSRVGDFKFDSQGYLVDSSGSVVYGFVTQSGGDEPGTGNLENPAVSTQLVPIRLPIGAPAPTDPNAADAVQEGTAIFPGVGDDGMNVYADGKAIIVDSITIDRETGKINAVNNADGKQLVIGYIAIAKVNNPNGVTHLTGPYYRAGEGAGECVASSINGAVTGNLNNAAAGAEGAQVIPSAGELNLLTGGLESSGTDLATEISEMITTQRGYQANTRIITVTDSMLEELVNMKR